MYNKMLGKRVFVRVEWNVLCEFYIIVFDDYL